MKIAGIELGEWYRHSSGSYHRDIIKSDIAAENYIIISVFWENWKCYFWDELYYLNDHYQAIYGGNGYSSIEEAKDQIDQFLVKMANLTAFS